MFQAVIFDIGGTLVGYDKPLNWSGLYRPALEYIAEECKFNFTENDYQYIGRQEQYNDPRLCHAEVGARKAYDFLIREKVDEREALAVKSAIKSHRFRGTHIPDTIEAKILFDADTIDATGAMEIARSLQYEGKLGIPIYHVDGNGDIIDGGHDANESFFQEYECKLNLLYDRLYTEKGREIANQRREIARKFFESLKNEAAMSHAILKNKMI